MTDVFTTDIFTEAEKEKIFIAKSEFAAFVQTRLTFLWSDAISKGMAVVVGGFSTINPKVTPGVCLYILDAETSTYWESIVGTPNLNAKLAYIDNWEFFFGGSDKYSNFQKYDSQKYAGDFEVSMRVNNNGFSSSYTLGSLDKIDNVMIFGTTHKTREELLKKSWGFTPRLSYSGGNLFINRDSFDYIEGIR